MDGRFRQEMIDWIGWRGGSRHSWLFNGMIDPDFSTFITWNYCLRLHPHNQRLLPVLQTVAFPSFLPFCSTFSSTCILQSTTAKARSCKWSLLSTLPNLLSSRSSSHPDPNSVYSKWHTENLHAPLQFKKTIHPIQSKPNFQHLSFLTSPYPPLNESPILATVPSLPPHESWIQTSDYRSSTSLSPLPWVTSLSRHFPPSPSPSLSLSLSHLRNTLAYVAVPMLPIHISIIEILPYLVASSHFISSRLSTYISRMEVKISTSNDIQYLPSQPIPASPNRPP